MRLQTPSHETLLHEPSTPPLSEPTSPHPGHLVNQVFIDGAADAPIVQRHNIRIINLSRVRVWVGSGGQGEPQCTS